MIPLASFRSALRSLLSTRNGLLATSSRHPIRPAMVTTQITELVYLGVLKKHKVTINLLTG